MKAIWNDQVIAESDETVVIEGNHYFPPSSVKKEFFKEIDQVTVCPWKGEASYYDLVDGEDHAAGAAWYYHKPKPDSFKRTRGIDFTDYVAFYPNIVEVTE